MALTPMMQQYLDIKEQYQDSILFFRLGDFYEMFFDDAIIASKAMEITLTGKSCGLEERAPMCGVPYHAAEVYIGKLIDKGYKVAICEQMEDPALAKGIVKRDVIRIVTPGTVLSQSMLKEEENNYLVSVVAEQQGVGLSYCDVSTGEIATLELLGQGRMEKLQNELVKLSAKELLVRRDSADAESLMDFAKAIGISVTTLTDSYYSPSVCHDRILGQFSVHSLHGLGIVDSPEAVLALGSLLSYLMETQKQTLSHIRSLQVIDVASHMSLDKATIRNLELTETLFEKRTQGSLLGVLDRTETAMGSRKLKQWIREPLNQVKAIQERLESVSSLVDRPIIRNNLRLLLKQIYDLERLAGRIASGNANGRDMIAIKQSLHAIPDIKAELISCDDFLLKVLEESMDDLANVTGLIELAIVDEPPFTIREGNLIREGYSEELDRLKLSIRDGQAWIAGLEDQERKRTGIKNLKVGFNKVFGYYLEVTKSYYDSIPTDYIRKQTLVNCERFITPELKEVEGAVLNAEAKINQLEYQLFQQIRENIESKIAMIQRTSSALSEIDVLLSYAEVSSRMGYVMPVVEEGDSIQIEKGRHPVLEQTTKDGQFVPNDLYLDRKDQSLLLITGPNMAGKSTYMRQSALIVLMAQIGCFVPADRARIGLVDRIYTRIGASDNLSQGQSTFYVEMSELAYILNTATEKSLVILDEIGRGTSTYDGLSIAWSVVEDLCSQNRHIRTLFATHYHELTVLEGLRKGVKNLNVDVQDRNGTILFLHKILEGSTSKSYGIHVAKLAGVPDRVLQRSESKLLELERSSAGVDHQNAEFVNPTEDLETSVNEQLNLFHWAESKIVKRLLELDLMEIKPSEAIAILEELKDAARK